MIIIEWAELLLLLLLFQSRDTNMVWMQPIGHCCNQIVVNQMEFIVAESEPKRR
jgi:hypothetical protein